MNQIVCFSHSPWAPRPTRTQQLMSRLSGTQVLYFEAPDPKGAHPERRGQKVRPHILVYTLPRAAELGGPRNSPPSRRVLRKTAACVEQAMARHQFREPLLWCTTPENLHILDYLACRGVVYDCHRYWTGLPAEWEGELAAAADVCFAASEGLCDRLAPCTSDVTLLPNGVNYPLFRQSPTERPPGLDSLGDQPVLGFTGTLRADTDVEPLLLAARLHPQWVFLLVGPAEPSAALEQLKALPNFLLVGRRPLVELPDYLGCCRVCFNLLRHREADSDVIPSRVYEYLAAGKPSVTMLWRHQQEIFPGLVRGARTPEEFVVQCEAALEEDPTLLLPRRRSCAAAAAWDRRAAQAAYVLNTGSLCRF